MCGIFFSLNRAEHVLPDVETDRLLRNRGPDSTGKHLIQTTGVDSTSPAYHAAFLSTVLSLRGDSIVAQPLRDEATGSVLCWNGEAWTIGAQRVHNNDSNAVFDLLRSVISSSLDGPRDESIQNVIDSLSRIRGPFAFVFYDAINHFIYFGRDCLGRRSLLRKTAPDGGLILSSVCDNSTGEHWAEVEADGVYVVDLLRPSAQTIDVIQIPHRRKDAERDSSKSFGLPFPDLRSTLDPTTDRLNEQHVAELGSSLRTSLELRVQHVRESIQSGALSDSRIAILFSGGLDCTVLARLCHDLLPTEESVDLLNVAFENPRIHSNLGENISPYELCPDRITGRSSYDELRQVCPERQWRLVLINVPYTETVKHRSQVMTLMHPHNTEMDLSISYALYFASRGSGLIQVKPDGQSQEYTTPAHVLLSGLGADELFGGYQRHAVAFSRKGYPGLVDELALDFNRLGKRNLGRDDRVISNSGREVRFPYLDEAFIAMALDLPVTAKCDFGNGHLPDSENPSSCLEPGKRILRMLAWDLGMRRVAAEKKRAIQFGTRTAKMETGKTKGTHVLT